MTQDEIIRMAQQVQDEGFAPVGIWPEVRRLCELAFAAGAAHESEKQAEQEPVGYWDGKFSKGGASALYEVPQASAFGYHYENYPLYAAPVRTKDLTVSEIQEAWNKETNLKITTREIDFARAVIAADREKNNV